ncbi:MAG TPA: sugar ABC transporter ATP-binding protein [Ruminococcaceae bacterium]|nr:sugar ABC transporter ATP-binding protein [Oscillospiraceae bacterium]
MANVVLEDVTKKYGNIIAVNDANLQIQDKEFVVFVGPSGCGKSTTLRMIAGLEDVTEGNIIIDDMDVTDLPPKDRDIAMVFQNYALYPHMNVYNNMAFGLKLRKFPKDDIDKRVKQAAAMLGIEQLLDRKPKQLSGGQRQRVALGRAIVREPKVFLMDEPLSNLDAKLRVQMRSELGKLHHRMQTTTIYVTHDQTEAMTMADRIVVMKDGLIQQVDSPQTLYDLPVNMFVAGFIGSPQMNFIDSVLLKKGDDLFVEFGSEDTKTTRGTKYQIKLPASKNAKGVLDEYIDKEIIVGIRPEDVHDEPRYLEAMPDCIIKADIEVTEKMGSETYLYFNTEGYSFTARVEPTSVARPGDKIDVVIDNNKIHIFDKETERSICN